MTFALANTLCLKGLKMPLRLLWKNMFYVSFEKVIILFQAFHFRKEKLILLCHSLKRNFLKIKFILLKIDKFGISKNENVKQDIRRYFAWVLDNGGDQFKASRPFLFLVDFEFTYYVLKFSRDFYTCRHVSHIYVQWTIPVCNNLQLWSNKKKSNSHLAIRKMIPWLIFYLFFTDLYRSVSLPKKV